MRKLGFWAEVLTRGHPSNVRGTEDGECFRPIWKLEQSEKSGKKRRGGRLENECRLLMKDARCMALNNAKYFVMRRRSMACVDVKGTQLRAGRN